MHDDEKNAKMDRKGDFDPGCVTEIYNTLTGHNFALRAFGALLRSSDLTDFSEDGYRDPNAPGNRNAEELRYGLSQLIELYLAHQEQVLTGYVDQYHESDIWLIKRSADLISMIEQGAFISREIMANELREAISMLDIVIARGGDLVEKAAAMKASILTRHKGG